ncbi:MBL fold metallo-hydrolase [Desulfocurvus sp. DL9XJH121]
MHVQVTYVCHNCFVVRAGKLALVFDYPGAEHRPPEAEAVVREALADRDAVAFFSHSHEDHCSPDILGPLGAARSAALALSFDVPDMVPELDLPGAVVLEPGDAPGGGDPGEEAHVAGLSVRALESNDLGVAFLIRLEGLRIYYGGDLAEWLWPGLARAAETQVRNFFGRSIEAVRDFAPDLAFTDCDLRLPGLGGFQRFAEAVRPPVLVPTHDFGKPQDVCDRARGLAPAGVRLMTYAACGDTRTFTF